MQNIGSPLLVPIQSMDVFIKYGASIYTKHSSLDHVNGRDPNQGS